MLQVCDECANGMHIAKGSLVQGLEGEQRPSVREEPPQQVEEERVPRKRGKKEKEKDSEEERENCSSS